MVTPLLGPDSIDHRGTQRLIEHLIGGDVAGIFILGTTGEAPSLSYRLRREFIKHVADLIAGRVPLLVGITDTAFIESMGIAQAAADAGADALVLSTPYYFPAGQTELLQYVERTIEVLPLPLMLYNMPSLTKVWFEFETLQSLCTHPKIIGVKDSSGDLNYFRELTKLCKQRPDWTLLMGPEHLLVDALELGGHGGVHGGANCFPRLFTQLFQAWHHSDSTSVQKTSEQIHQLQEIYKVGKYASRFIKATKCALSLMEICSDRMAEPFNHFLAPERARVAQILSQLKTESE